MSHRSLVMVKRTYLHIAIVTLLSATVWMIVTIYQAMTKPGIVAVDKEVLSVVNPTLDEAALNTIIARENVAAIPFVPPSLAPEPTSINEVTVTELPITAETIPIASISGGEL